MFLNLTEVIVGIFIEVGGRVWCMQVQTGLAMARPYLHVVTVCSM